MQFFRKSLKTRKLREAMVLSKEYLGAIVANEKIRELTESVNDHEELVYAGKKLIRELGAVGEHPENGSKNDLFANRTPFQDQVLHIATPDECRVGGQKEIRKQSKLFDSVKIFGVGLEHPISPQGKIASVPNKRSGEESITLDELIDRFCHYKLMKKQWNSPRGAGQQKNKLIYLKNVLEALKGRKRIKINEFIQSDVEKFEEIYQLFPVTHKKPYKDLSFNELVKISQKSSFPVEDRISGKTYNFHAELLMAMFKFATSKRNKLLNGENYFTDMKVKITSQQKRQINQFSNDDLRKFFGTSLFVEKSFQFKYAWKFWIPVIMMYSGMRVEESSQLTIGDIENVDNTVCFIVKSAEDKLGKIITRTKTDSSVRVIPIHSKIIRMGFMSYIQWLKLRNESKVFPSLSNISIKGKYKQAGAAVSKWFNEDDKKQSKYSYITSCGIDKSKGKVLYSFRHTVQTFLNNHPDNIENDKIDSLFGHEVKSIGRKHYGGYDAATMLRVVELIDYPDAYLPWDVNPDYMEIKFPWQR